MGFGWSLDLYTIIYLVYSMITTTGNKCGTCDNYIYPPDDYKGRADIGYCKLYKEMTNENDYCGKDRGYMPIPDEED